MFVVLFFWLVLATVTCVYDRTGEAFVSSRVVNQVGPFVVKEETKEEKEEEDEEEATSTFPCFCQFMCGCVGLSSRCWRFRVHSRRLANKHGKKHDHDTTRQNHTTSRNNRTKAQFL